MASRLSKQVKDACQEGKGSSSSAIFRREKLFPDSMRKSTLANLETKTLKAFCNIFAHHKNAVAKISDWMSYIPVNLHTKVRAQIRSVLNSSSDHRTQRLGACRWIDDGNSLVDAEPFVNQPCVRGIQVCFSPIKFTSVV